MTIEAGASLWYGAVIRADHSAVIVRAGANVQAGSVLHGPPAEFWVQMNPPAYADLARRHAAGIEPVDEL